MQGSSNGLQRRARRAGVRWGVRGGRRRRRTLVQQVCHILRQQVQVLRPQPHVALLVAVGCGRQGKRGARVGSEQRGAQRRTPQPPGRRGCRRRLPGGCPRCAATFAFDMQSFHAGSAQKNCCSPQLHPLQLPPTPAAPRERGMVPCPSQTPGASHRALNQQHAPQRVQPGRLGDSSAALPDLKICKEQRRFQLCSKQRCLKRGMPLERGSVI